MVMTGKVIRGEYRAYGWSEDWYSFDIIKSDGATISEGGFATPMKRDEAAKKFAEEEGIELIAWADK